MIGAKSAHTPLPASRSSIEITTLPAEADSAYISPMTHPIIPKDPKLLRLMSARFDMGQCLDAYGLMKAVGADSPFFQHLAVSMVVSYGRPFTENHGVGNLLSEFNSYPDFGDADLNMRHQRLIDLRHNFMAHSSCVGTAILILPAGQINPVTGKPVDRIDHLVGKRNFGDIRFYDWLKDAPFELKARLDRLVRTRLDEVGATLDVPTRMETGYDTFNWKDSQ